MSSGLCSNSIASSISIVAYIIWNVGFVMVMAPTLMQDHSLRHESCGEATHVWKYMMLNLVWALITILSFCTFPAGGEAARARAVTMVIFHYGLLVWGLLMMASLSTACEQVFETKFETVIPLVYICVAHNGFFGSLFLLHEIFVGDLLGYDATIIAQIHFRKKAHSPYLFDQQKDHMAPQNMIAPQNAPDLQEHQSKMNIYSEVPPYKMPLDPPVPPVTMKVGPEKV